MLVVIGGLWLGVAPLGVPWADSHFFVPHGAITIIGDAGFTAANGVVGGQGTVDDPYRISGWDIVAPQGREGILIISVRAHFVIENNRIQAAGFPNQFSDGVHLENAGSGGIVRNNILHHNLVGIVVFDSNVLVEGNIITSNYQQGSISGAGVWATGNITSLVLRNNTIADNHPYGVYRGFNFLLPPGYWSLVDAAQNYWGSPLPPSMSVRVNEQYVVPVGLPGGNYVTPRVSFAPWLLEPPS